MESNTKTTGKNAPTFYIRTYGCQMNVLDSEVITGELVARGFIPTKAEDEADIILFNTCAVRDHAERRVLGKLGLLKRLKSEKPHLILGILGCTAQRKKQELLKEFPHLDIVCGTGGIARLPDLVEQAIAKRTREIDVSLNGRENLPFDTAARSSTTKAFVSIMRGCENYCSYCIVPFVRGKEISRPPDEIIDEIKRLAAQGYREVTLLGQNVNSYGRSLAQKCDFPELLEKVAPINGIERIRFVTSHPKDISPELIDVMAAHEKICPYLHLPVQSGSDKILDLMNRDYTSAHYLQIVRTLRERIPDIALGTDIIVGFPGETQEDFDHTLRLIREVQYDTLFVFKYSPRKGTKAALIPDDVPIETKQTRNQKILELQEEIITSKHRSLIGATVSVLVEGSSKRDPNRLTGRTPHNRIAVFEGDQNDIGQIINLKIYDATSRTLYCRKSN